MCLIAFAWQASAEFPFALVANRDEFHERPTEALRWWLDAPIAAGRDLKAGGTWLGLNRQGRFAAVTNVREGKVEQSARVSRGELVTRALTRSGPLDQVEQALAELGEETAGFNLLVGDLFGAHHSLRYLTNRSKVNEGPGARALTPHVVARTVPAGVYALSNAGLDDDWPKTRLAEQQLRRALRHRDPDGFWTVTESREVADVEDLPDTGVEQDVERFLSAAFIVGDNYGTRSTTRILSQPHTSIDLTERRFDALGELTGSTHIRLSTPDLATSR